MTREEAVETLSWWVETHGIDFRVLEGIHKRTEELLRNCANPDASGRVDMSKLRSDLARATHWIACARVISSYGRDWLGRVWPPGDDY